MLNSLSLEERGWKGDELPVREAFIQRYGKYREPILREKSDLPVVDCKGQTEVVKKYIYGVPIDRLRVY